jgi:hypothetical protein
MKPHLQAKLFIGNFGVEYWVVKVKKGRFKEFPCYSKVSPMPTIYPNTDVYIRDNILLLQKTKK